MGMPLKIPEITKKQTNEIKPKSFCIAKEAIDKKIRSREWEKMFENDLSNKRQTQLANDWARQRSVSSSLQGRKNQNTARYPVSLVRKIIVSESKTKSNLRHR